MLDDAYIVECEQRARRFSGAYTGTSGTLAAAVLHLLAERKELMQSLDDANRTIREAVAARMAATPADDPKMAGYSPPPPPVPPNHDHDKTLRRPLWLVGLAGNIGSGKSEAARMIPEAFHLQWADPIYRGLAAMFGVPEETLRDRDQKERPLDGLGVTPRLLARTLGTEWGRELIHADVWVRLAMRTVDRVAAAGKVNVFAICGTRFPNEAAAIRERGGEVWWIDRPGTTTGGHVSDTMLRREDCDRVIVNSGTLDKLRHNVEAAFTDFTARHAAASTAPVG